jgi:hypothetical protein
MEFGFRMFVRVLGCVAVGAGAMTVLLGADSIFGVQDASPSVDSEMRFYAAWYVGAGLLLLRATFDLELETLVVRGVAAIFFLAGCARALSWATVGRPHDVAVVLMVIELILPIVLVPWQMAIAGRRATLTDT